MFCIFCWVWLVVFNLFNCCCFFCCFLSRWVWVFCSKFCFCFSWVKLLVRVWIWLVSVFFWKLNCFWVNCFFFNLIEIFVSRGVNLVKLVSNCCWCFFSWVNWLCWGINLFCNWLIVWLSWVCFCIYVLEVEAIVWVWCWSCFNCCWLVCIVVFSWGRVWVLWKDFFCWMCKNCCWFWLIFVWICFICCWWLVIWRLLLL